MTALPYYEDDSVRLLLGDALDQLQTLADGSVDCIVTSPPYYGLRDYGQPGQYGQENTPAAYVEQMRQVFAEARRALADEGTLWLNLGDSYSNPSSSGTTGATARTRATRGNVQLRASSTERPTKSLLMIPERVCLALQDDGWILRNKITWHKVDAMPESVRDRLARKTEPIYLLTKAQRYHFDLDAIREPQAASTAARSDSVPGATRNPGDLWAYSLAHYPGAHFATFPLNIPLRCIKAGCKPGGTVLDPFSGSGTTGAAARQLGRHYIGIDLNPAYHDLAVNRFAQGVFAFDETA
ncbi:DNA-methyltransferase [Streptomyces erythrochromogenes]|uniref:DNA-methyltransferase n=1 Tax=Streptomyces erythrochromogenes TaxID=285574 RepID=UPI002250D73A|nr:site-specific DNA-methyltransferase [Streptomyces erythrochromogenes]MCX5587591.1 site-specific DNA-methyltransferase [Streptomyces erythrochromogenes]